MRSFRPQLIAEAFAGIEDSLSDIIAISDSFHMICYIGRYRIHQYDRNQVLFGISLLRLIFEIICPLCLYLVSDGMSCCGNLKSKLSDGIVLFVHKIAEILSEKCPAEFYGI